MSTLIDARSRITAPEGRFKTSPGALIGIAVHHSVSGDNIGPEAIETAELAHLQAIDAYHVNQGFGGFGYHLAAFASGRLYQLGGLDGARAHVASRNHELLGIVAIGTFTQRMPAARQLTALRQGVSLCREFAGRALPVKGHGAWALPGEGTACPGLLSSTDWNQISEAPAAGCMVRCNGIAATLEGLSLPLGVSGGVLDLRAEFQLPVEARLVRLEVALKQGAIAFGDPEYAGRVDGAYGGRLGVIDVQTGADGRAKYDCPPGTTIERVGCLGYWT